MLELTPYPTAGGITRAFNAVDGGFEIKAKYIAVGDGRQAIVLDDAGRAITEALLNPLAFIEIDKAERISDGQWRMTVDLKGKVEGTWDFAEFALCDENKDAIAIYGSLDSPPLSISPLFDSALFAINLVLAAFPANSVVIEHHNLPLHLIFDKEFSQLHLAFTSNANDILELNEKLKTKLDSAEFGIVAAYQNMTAAQLNQETMQAGILSTRQYNYHGDVDAMRRVWDRNYNPGGSHNHPNYDRMSGNAEVTCITPTGDYIRMRHSDYRHKQAIKGEAFLSTEDVPLPSIPASVANADGLDAQINEMRDLYHRYQSGEFPEGFKWVITCIETWVEPFTDNISETFDSFRHQNQIDKAVDQFKLNKVYADTGLKDRFENLPINKVFVAGLKDDGSPILGVLKGRLVCKDLVEMGDLRPFIDAVDDPVMDVYRGIDNERFSLKEELNRPGILDRIMATVSGLDGAGSYLEEVHERYGKIEKIADFGTNKTQNAANYHRFGSQLSDDASNRRDYQAGFNIPNFFKALTMRDEVLPAIFEGKAYKISWAMPYELMLYHPVMSWNPLDLAINPEEHDKSGRGNTSENPFFGTNKNSVWYRTPDSFYTANSVSDKADTGAGVKWVRGPNNIAHPVRASGIYIELPEIQGVGKIRQRYPIYSRPQDGSYESSLAQAYHRRNLGMTDKLSAEITTILKNQIEGEK